MLFSIGLCHLPEIVSAQRNDTISFLFAGHTYQYGSNGKKIDYRFEQLDKSDYEGIWLGGDVCSEALLEYNIIQYIDSVVPLSNPENHWALGNHDARNGNWEWYEEFANRKTYYAYHSHGMTRIILNTNLVPTHCEMMDEQYEMITTVLDSIQESSHLILMMHHNIWHGVPGLPHPYEYSQSNLRYWNANCDSVNTSFLDIVYPKLLEVEARGVEVYCILGDMGSGLKKIDMESNDGIRFLGCGLYKNEEEDMVLIMNLHTVNQQLEYGYHRLDSLLLVK